MKIEHMKDKSDFDAYSEVKSRKRILVTGARLPAALEIIRAIHDEDAEVWAADSLRFTPAGSSRYIKGYLHFPSPALAFDDFKSFFCEAVSRLRIDLIVPVSEEIFYLALIQNELKPSVLFAPSLTELRRFHSKWEILAAAKDCGVRLPSTIRVTSSAELHSALEKIPDGIVKPEYSRGAFETHFPPHQDIGSLHISDTRPWLVQEKVMGREISSYCIAFKGRVLAQSVYEPLYRVGKGASLYFCPLFVPAANHFVSSFVKNNNLTGQFSFDLMEENNKSLVMLECNPRTTSGVHLFQKGCHWARAFWGEKIVAGKEEVSACAAKFAVVLFHGFPSLRNKRWRSFGSDLQKARDSSFLVTDPIPFIALQLTTLEILCRSYSWSTNARNAFTFDLEWNG